MNYLNPAYMFAIEQDDDADLEELIYLAMASKNMRERVAKRERVIKAMEELGEKSLETFNKIPDRLGDTPLYTEMKVRVRDKTTGRYTSIPGKNKVDSIVDRIADKFDRLTSYKFVENRVSNSEYNKAYNELVDACKLEISVIDKEIDRLASRNGATGQEKEILARLYRNQVKMFNEAMTEDMIKLGSASKQIREEYSTYAKELGRQTDRKSVV